MSISSTRLKIEDEWRRWCAAYHITLMPQSLLAFLQYRRWIDIATIERELSDK